MFDVDALLYFVAPDWWRPQTKPLTSMSDQAEVQATIIAEPSLTARSESIGMFPVPMGQWQRPYYLITEETKPAQMGASLGWLLQLDGDTHRNAFLNSPWVKAVLPIRPGREREAMTWLRRPEVAGADGLDEPYPFDPSRDLPEYRGLTMGQVLLKIADSIAQQYADSLRPVPVDDANPSAGSLLPAETVYEKGFDPLEGGVKFGAEQFKIFSQWTEILPTDQIVATEYSLKSLGN
jgi:hypothetical protein